MKKQSYYRTASHLILILTLTLFISSCSEDSQINNTSEHFEAEGTLFLDGSRAPYLQIFRGTIDPAFKTRFTAPLNNLSDAFIVKFLSPEKKELNPPTSSSIKLTWKIDDASFVEVYQHEGEEGGYEFHLRGKKTGTTFIEFYLTHGDHSDYRSGKIPVEVQRDSTTIENPTILFNNEETEEELASEKSDGTVMGELNATAGETTDHIEIEFMNEDGTKPKLDASIFSISITSSDTTVATIIPPSVDEPFAFNIKGNKVGTAKITVILRRFIEGKTIDLVTFSGVPIIVK